MGGAGFGAAPFVEIADPAQIHARDAREGPCERSSPRARSDHGDSDFVHVVGAHRKRPDFGASRALFPADPPRAPLTFLRLI